VSSVTSNSNLVRPEWPCSARFAICLTHDVDRVRKTKFHSVYYFLKERKLHHMRSLLKGDGAYWNFDNIIGIEEKNEVRSTFFFLNDQDLFRDRPSASVFDPREWSKEYTVNNTYVLDITIPVNALWSRIKKRTKWSIRKAERSGLSVLEVSNESHVGDSEFIE
jgi:hypothetical protein